MSHELRTPLGMKELLLRTPLDGQQQRCATTLKPSAKALLRLIDGILDFSQI